MINYTDHFGDALDALETLRKLGCDIIFLKKLSPNNDNSKNQIYMGTNVATFQKIPGVVATSNISRSTAKTLSSAGELILVQEMDFSWVDPNGIYRAPQTKLIYYFQYPEIRLSGFLNRAAKSPQALRISQIGEFKDRLLLIGIKDQQTYGILLCSPMTKNIRSLSSATKSWSGSDVLSLVFVSKNYLRLDPTKLVKEIKGISRNGPQASVSLKVAGEGPRPFKGPQGAGYTLEAHLGIPRNGISAPDKYGYEVKTYQEPPITLITTEPDSGVRYDSGLATFLKSFGWEGKKGDGSLRFNGKHTALGKSPKDSRLVLKLNNWDYVKSRSYPKTKPNITLESTTGIVAAGWSFEKIGEAWMKKHAGAVYVHYIPSTVRGSSAFTYKPIMYVCEGTSLERFFSAIATGMIYLDSGDRMLSNGEHKKRTQWRLHATNNNLEEKLNLLYESVRKIST
jgi:hypothetical protein